MARVIVIKFPGSSAEEVAEAYSQVLGIETQILWHDTETIPQTELLVVPGGSSFADYLRPGALAKASPIAAAIRRTARSSRVLGIGNGFQILCEFGVLPGSLLSNVEGSFISKEVSVVTETSCSKLSPETGQVYQCPIACEYGCYYLDVRALSDLEEAKQVVFRYSDPEGVLLSEPPTGSVKGIAGLSNQQGNVLGLMFHPERSVEANFNSGRGKEILLSALNGVNRNT